MGRAHSRILLPDTAHATPVLRRLLQKKTHLHPPRSTDEDRIRLQQSEVSWLIWLSEMEWRQKDHHWTDSPEDAQLCLGLPLATSDADTADDTPVRFIDMDQPQLIPAPLKRTLQTLQLNAPPPALEPALAGLRLSDRMAFEHRWRVLDLDKTTELPAPRARKITRLVTAQSDLTPSRTLRRPRTWLQRLAPLQVAEDSTLMAAANRLDTVEILDTDLVSKPPTPLADRLVTWGQLQRARAHLVRHLTAWDPTTVPTADRAEAQGERQRLLDRLQGMPTSVRHLSVRALRQVRKAGVDDDQLVALNSTLKTYAHRVHQPLPADPTALSELQTLEDWARRLVSSLDKQVAELQQDMAQPVPKDLEKVRVALKTDLRQLSDAMTIAQEMQSAPADRPAMRATPAELMALAAQPDITPAMRQAAWQAGATPADLMRVHQAPGDLPPTWALLADSVLQERAVALVKEHTGRPHADAQAVAATRQRLQATYPLSEVAAMARLAMNTADAPPDMPDIPNTPPSPQGHLPLGGSQVMRALSWNVELSVSDDSPQAQALGTAITAYDQAVRALESLPLDSPGLATAATQAEQRLLDLHKALLLATAVGGLRSMGAVLLNESAVLKKLPIVAARLVAARPPSGLASPDNTATQLLSLLAPDGPGERWLLHGWLAGWQLADIGQAHQDGLPTWVMDLDGSASVARARHLRLDVPERMGQLQNQMILPSGS